MVALDHSGIPYTRFNDVGIDGTLRQKVDRADLFGLLFKDADKLLTDNFALALWIGDAFELGQKSVLRVDPDKVDRAVREDVYKRQSRRRPPLP